MKSFNLNVLCTMLIIVVISLNSSNAASLGYGETKTHNYYVATNGNNDNKGTVDAPFKTINAGLGKAIAGDIVFVRGGTYFEKVIFPRSGLLNNFITLKAYPKEKPVLDGTSLPISGKEALVTIRNVSYILFEGFDVCNYKSILPWVNINGILIDGGSCNIQVRKNHIYNVEHNVALKDGRSGHGIEIIGNTTTAMKNIIVEENEIHDCKTGYSENLTINGYVDGFIIRNNTIYNTENIGIDAAGGYWANSIPALNYARNGLITGNILYNVETSRGPLGGYGAIGIYVDGARNIIVEKNKIYDTDRGIGIVSENEGFPSRGCIVRNNFIYNNWRTGIYLGGYLNSKTVTDSCYVVNNTLLFNNKVVGYYNELEGEIRLTENCRDNIIQNNLVYARPLDLMVHKYTKTGGNNIIDHNLYYSLGTPAWLWNSVNDAPVTDFASWKAFSGMDSASLYGIDPLLKDTVLPDLHIRRNSIAKGVGIILPGGINGSTDIDGQKRIVNNSISIGADEPQ